MKWADNVIEQYDTSRYKIIELSYLMEIRGNFDNDLPPKIYLDY